MYLIVFFFFWPVGKKRTAIFMGKKNMELDVIRNKIYEIRGQRVMLDRDLAQLYGVETKVLNQAVRRNLERFPDDFMFELTMVEVIT